MAPILQDEYRRRFSSLFDRADLYVAFVEHGLHQLSKDGALSFICADRWTLNRYGAPLRRLIAERFHVRHYIDLHQASPFESEVIAYPAIFSIGRAGVDRVRVAALQEGSAKECADLSIALGGGRPNGSPTAVIDYPTWFRGDEPWILLSPEQLTVLRDLEDRHPALESEETRVRIGVATGNDSVYIVADDVDIEPDRLVPLVMREDIEGGRIRDAHRCVINTFSSDGSVVDLNQYPRLAAYLGAHAEVIRSRHVARNNKPAWFRTIDRVYPGLVRMPKLLIPDIAGANEVVLDEGRFHPHHNLYFVTSASWDMRVLGGLLSSKVALFFVWAYAVKMRGGYLRFQAQYLRRIRVPAPKQLSPHIAAALSQAFEDRNFSRIDELALQAYGLRNLPGFHFVDTRS